MSHFARSVLAPLVLRLGLAVVFIYHAMTKLGPDTKWGVGWNKDLPAAVQVTVAWCELLGGVALALGFLTRLAALGLTALLSWQIGTFCAGQGFALPDGYEYHFIRIVMTVAVALMGSGPLGLDYLLWPKRDEPAKKP